MFGEKKSKGEQGKPGESLVGSYRASQDRLRAKRHQELKDAVSDVAQALQLTSNGSPITATEARPIRDGADVQRIATSSTRLVGWSLSATVAAHVRFRAGRDEYGDILVVVDIPAGGSSSMRVGGPGGLNIGNDGLTMQITPKAAAVGMEGSVHIGAVD